MTDCWAYPVHPGYPAKSSGGPPGGGGYPSDGTLPVSEYRRIKRVTVLVDSRDRDYEKHPSPSRYVVALPEPLYNVSNAVLISAELPATYYVFSAAASNTTLRTTVGPTTLNVSIPDGNYTLATMKTALQTALNSAFGGGFTVDVSDATSKFSIACTSAFSIDCTGAAKPTAWGLGYYLGLEGGKVTGSDGGGKITGTYVASMNPEMYMVISIDELNSVKQAGIYGSITQGKVFAKVPLCRGAFQYSFYDKTLTCNELQPPRAKLDKLTISLRFHDGTPVDFHGAEHSMTIEFACTQTR